MQQPVKETEGQPTVEYEDRGHGLSWFVWAIFGLAAYLLAVGPAVKLHRAVPQVRPAIQAIYFWVDPLTRISPQFNAAVEWYVFKVWRVK